MTDQSSLNSPKSGRTGVAAPMRPVTQMEASDMTNVDENTARVEEARAWLVQHKEQSGASWPDLGRLTDNGSSTLSLFAGEKYNGDNVNVAIKILAYRDRLHAQARLADEIQAKPEWYDNRTTQELTQLLRYAQSGKLVLIVTPPGIGKTKVAERFTETGPNIWLATMSPATAGVSTMASEIAEAIGLGQVTGSPHQLSRKIREHLAGRRGLIIIDEAQELNDKSLNEIRSWHDRTGVGIALLGNDKVIGQIDSRKSALAQVSSRFSYRHIQKDPFPEDIDACLDAWGILDRGQREFLHRLGRLPGALRELTHTIEIASIAAGGSASALTLDRLRAAARSRNPKFGSL